MTNVPALPPQPRRWRGVRPVWLAAGLLSGCATGEGFKSLEDEAWLVDGKTTRAEVIARLGEPVQYYQGGYILAYRYDQTDHFQRIDGDFRSRSPVGYAYANLILVFGADKVLLRHSRVVLK